MLNSIRQASLRLFGAVSHTIPTGPVSARPALGLTEASSRLFNFTRAIAAAADMGEKEAGTVK